MKLPAIIVNFKTYESATGDNALTLAKIHEKVSHDTGLSFGVCVQASDVYRISNEVSIPVFAQHIDAVTFGSYTGHILPESMKEAGAFGTLLNHAERQISIEIIDQSIKRAKEVGLFTLVCANTPEAGEKIATFDPDLIAVEPPELIGGDISVSTAQPEIITKAVELCGKGKVLVGAGVKTQEDTKKAVELGASGVLLASGVTKAQDPEAVLRDLAKGLQ